MEVFLVGAADPVGHDGHLTVSDDLERLQQAHRAQVARLAAKMRFDFGQGGKPEIRQAGQLAHLDFVHVVVAPQQQQPDLGLGDFALLVHDIGGQHQGLDGALQRHRQKGGHVRAGALARRGGAGHGLGGRRALGSGCGGLGLFHVGRVLAVRAVDDGVFTGGGDHLELFAQVAADGAAVRRHGAVLQPETVEDAAVGGRHHLVALFGTGLVAVKAVGVLHDELAPTHQAKTRAALVAELGLDLVEILGQLLVAAEFLAGDVRHHFFAGGLHHIVALMAVLDAQQLGAHLIETAGFLPKLGGLHDGHGQFHGAGTVHLLAHDLLHLVDHPQAHRHVAVDAGAQFLDHAGPRHELVADHLGIGRRILEGGDKELGRFHCV